MFIDVLEQIEVNIKVISPHNLDTVRNIDKFCQFGHTYAPNLDFSFLSSLQSIALYSLASYRSVMPIEADVLAIVVLVLALGGDQ